MDRILTAAFLLSMFVGVVVTHANPSRFTTTDCERLLLGKSVIYKKKTTDFLKSISAWPLDIEKYKPIKSDDLPDDEVLFPEIVFFDKEADEGVADEETRYAEARRRRHEVLGEALKALEAQTEEGLREATKKYIADEEEKRKLPLSALEKSALGLPKEATIALADLKLATAKFDSESSSLHISVEDTKGLIHGVITLATSTLRQGFSNRVDSWQSKQALFRSQDPLEPSELPRPESFLRDRGVNLLLRQVGDVTFGYLFAFPVGTKAEAREDFRLEIFLVRQCNRVATDKTEILFPDEGKASGHLNLCLAPLELRFSHGEYQ